MGEFVDQVWVTLGEELIHPYNSLTRMDNDLCSLTLQSPNSYPSPPEPSPLPPPLAPSPGECGLDFNRNFSPPDVQIAWFQQQVALAVELNKPLFMHCRDAGAKFAEILSAAGSSSSSSASSGGGSGASNGDAAAAAAAGEGLPRQRQQQQQLPVSGVLHCFTGNGDELRDCLDLGLHIGITGWVCDDRPERGGAELAALLSTIPRDRLMIETDAPYLVPRTIKPSKARPHRNEPSLLPHVLAQVAAALGEGEGEVGMRTSKVAVEFFGLPAEVLEEAVPVTVQVPN